MNRKEAQASPKAKAAMDMQWTRLRNRMAWDESSVREWSDVAAEARRKSQEVHMGMLFGFDVEKNLDVPEGDPRRKFKGVGVPLCSRTAPATMGASRIADCYGCFTRPRMRTVRCRTSLHSGHNMRHNDLGFIVPGPLA